MIIILLNLEDSAHKLQTPHCGANVINSSHMEAWKMGGETGKAYFGI